MTPSRIDRLPAHIDTLLLDLDGTLLDLAFDNHFWLQVVPEAFASRNGLSVQQAAADLAPLFAAVEHTLPWYCLDHWSRTLDMDLALLKTEHAWRAAWLPGAQAFLRRQRAAGRRLVLATNSHPQVLRIKDAQLRVTDHLDAAWSSHGFGAPKEDPQFWAGFRRAETFDPGRTAFLDDNLRVLEAAADAGVACLVAVTAPDSTRPDKDPPSRFDWVRAVAEIA
ncbi:MAG: nucleotidase [Pseudomonadota bacterium]|jgi:putative hydrolase of the HAD superfamily